MGQFNMTFGYMIALSLSMIVIVAVFLWIRRKQQQKQTVTDNTDQPRVRKRFSGQRVYSLPLFGKYRWVLRFVYGSTVVLPLMMVLGYWRATANYPGGVAGGSGNTWFILAGAAVWSVTTVLFLRAMVRYRRQTAITLTADGVRYHAPKVGLFPKKDISMAWDEIQNVTLSNTQRQSVITVKSAKENFCFDLLQVVEVVPYPADGGYTTVENGHDLYCDLLEHSGLPLPPEMEKASPEKISQNAGRRLFKTADKT